MHKIHQQSGDIIYVKHNTHIFSFKVRVETVANTKQSKYGATVSSSGEMFVSTC